MRKRFQVDEYGQQMEDGQRENSYPYNKSQLINGVHSPRQGFDTYNREKYTGYDNNQSKPLCTEIENENKSKTPSLLPHIARHFSINDDDDDDMLLPPNSMVDSHSKTGMDNPVALGPDQGYPKGSESTRGYNNGLVKPTLNVTSKIHFNRIDEMATHIYEADRNIAATENNQSQMREVWTKLYGKASAREETLFNSNPQPSYPMQAFNADYFKSAGNLPQHISTVISHEGHTMKSDGATIHRRPIHGSLPSEKPNTVQNLSSTIISMTKTRSETLEDKQKEEKINGLKVNYQPTLVTSSDIVFLDVMNSSKYNAEEHNQKQLAYKKNFHLSKNKTLYPNFSPIRCDQIKNQFTQNPAYNIEGSDQSILDINDSIFDYSATGSISEHSSISTNLPVVPALSSSASSTHGSKSDSLDENKPKQDKAANSVSPNERKSLHTKMTQLTKNSLFLEDRNADLDVNFNVPNKMPIFSSSQSQQSQKDTYTDDGSMSFDIDDTILTVESIESDTEKLKVQMPDEMTNSHISNMDDVKQQLHNLTFMYQQLFHLLSQNKKLQNAQPWSTDSVKGNSLIKTTHLQRRKSMRSTILETKHNKKHFQRLEAHVVTLVQSVATLTDQVRAHTNALKQIDILKEELQEMKETMCDGNNHVGISSLHNYLKEYERFRGWIPSLTNPKRVQKLTKFFGQEPPLLEIFLKKLGYERYLSNFSNEHIGMLELPYMTEERLQSIGIPMGPRLRILQESQLCFRQENFNIYII